MTTIYNFSEAKKNKELNSKLFQGNTVFIETYRKVSDIENLLLSKWGSVFDDEQSLYNKLSSTVFKTAQNHKDFYSTLMWTLGIYELPLSELTFSSYKKYGSVTHRLAVILYERERVQQPNYY